MIEIVLYDEIYRESVREIFYMSSSIQSFSSDERREAFFKRWCGDYITYYPNQFYIMLDLETRKVLGYLSGCDDSIDSLKKLEVPGHSIFQDLFSDYPAHFHINFHADCRGRGLGSKLVDYYISVLRKNNITGIHLITSDDAKNITFYRRSNFTFENVRVFGNSRQLFMGQKLC